MENKKAIEIPKGVEISIEGKKIIVKGLKGELSRNYDNPQFNKLLTFEIKENQFSVSSQSGKKKIKAMLGTIISQTNNMILGVTKGFRYVMKIYSVHFPMNITLKDDEVHIKNFIGEKTLRAAKIGKNVAVNVQKDEIIVSGIDIENVGQTCANIEKTTKLSKRDRRIFQDGIFLAEKYLETGEKL